MASASTKKSIYTETMNHKFKIRAVLWLVVAGLLVWMLLAHGRAIGGVQYFSHVGAGGAALAELALIAGSVALARAAWINSRSTSGIALAVAAVALIYALSFWVHAPVLSFFNPLVIPLGWLGVLLPWAVLILAVSTALIPR